MGIFKKIYFLMLLVAVLGSFVTNGFAQSGTYIVQVQDLLKVSYWEYPSLSAKVRVERDGGIDLPLVGEITAAGLSINVLRQKIISQMSLYNKIVTQISIEIVEYGKNIVHVTGHVKKPGKYSFEIIPNLWEILLEAGGPLESASLSDVLIVRSDEGGRIYSIDLTKALSDATLDEMLTIKPGDTIQIQASGQPGQVTSPLIKKEVIYIFGAIGRQGSHIFQAGSNLLEVIGRAGGPAQNADLSNVKHISVSNGVSSIAIVDLESYMEKTIPLPMPIGPGDFVIIPKKSSLGPRLLNVVITTTVSSVLGTILFFVLKR